jgi:hypothetical protein
VCGCVGAVGAGVGGAGAPGAGVAGLGGGLAVVHLLVVVGRYALVVHENAVVRLPERLLVGGPGTQVVPWDGPEQQEAVTQHGPRWWTHVDDHGHGEVGPHLAVCRC